MANESVLNDVNELRKENQTLREAIATRERDTEIPELAPLDDAVSLRLEWKTIYKTQVDDYEEVAEATWSELFAAIGPALDEHPYDSLVNSRMASWLYRNKVDAAGAPDHIKIARDDFETVRVQLKALELVAVEWRKAVTGSVLEWTITRKGGTLLNRLRAIGPKQSKQQPNSG